MTEKSVMNIYYNFLLDLCSFLTKSKGFTLDLSDLLLIHIALFIVCTDQTALLTWLEFEEIYNGPQRTPWIVYNYNVFVLISQFLHLSSCVNQQRCAQHLSNMNNVLVKWIFTRHFVLIKQTISQ